MDIYRNSKPIVFPKENNGKNGNDDRSLLVKAAVFIGVMLASVIICFASVVTAHNLVKQYSAACTALQAELSQANEMNEALVEMLEERLGA